MKKNIFSILAVALITFSACNKSSMEETAILREVAVEGQPFISSWNAIAQWEQQTDEGSVYQGDIKATVIDSALLHNGLTLVYGNDGDGTSLLPFMDNRGTIWYYQVSAGKLTVIQQTASEENAANSDLSLSYVLIPEDKIRQLEARGAAKSDLINMSFEEISLLIKK